MNCAPRWSLCFPTILFKPPRWPSSALKPFLSFGGQDRRESSVAASVGQKTMSGSKVAHRPVFAHGPAQRCLTPRSKGAPTAGHQARAGGTRYIFTSPGLASHRWRPLSSNVRPQKTHSCAPSHFRLSSSTKDESLHTRGSAVRTEPTWGGSVAQPWGSGRSACTG
jgi:hypothetical protein